jgi:ribosomal protein L11 methyltransferase
VPAEWEELLSDWLIGMTGRGVAAEPAGAAAVVTAYCADSAQAEQVASEARRRWEAFCRDNGLDALLPVAAETISEEDWAASWKAHYHPVRVGGRLVIKPTWEAWPPGNQPQAARPGDLVIELDPEMAFGTGTHETTQMCLELLERHLRPGDTVADFGAGSGILSIAAALLGSGPVQGWELDPVAAEVARRNFERNGVGGNCAVTTGDALEAPAGRYGVVLANVHTPFLLRLIPRLPDCLAASGRAILSGASETTQPALLQALQAAGLETIEEAHRGEWVGVVARVAQ